MQCAEGFLGPVAVWVCPNEETLSHHVFSPESVWYGQL